MLQNYRFFSRFGVIQVWANPEKATIVAIDLPSASDAWSLFSQQEKAISISSAPPQGVLQLAVTQLQEYFAGERRVFDLPLEPQGTLFQKTVWSALKSIAYGKVTTYGALAKAIGRPHSARAVGGACHANPLPLVIPCHRVLGSNGKLTGFAGGLTLKQALLDWEREHRDKA